MPKDVVLARAIATQLTAQYLGKIKNINFDYNAYVDLDGLPNEPTVFVTLDNSPWIRLSRGNVRRDAMIRVTMISEIGPTDSAQWVDDQLNSFDMLVDYLLETPVNGQLPVDTESDDRYDVDRFHSNHRLVMDILFNYRNL